MSETNNTAAPAPAADPASNATPDIDAAEKHRQELDRLKLLSAEAQFENGRKKGFIEGEKAVMDRFAALVAVCPDKPQLAIDAFMKGQTPESVQMALDESAKIEAAAKVRERELELEKARWQALAATGGYPGGIAMGPTGDGGDESQPGLDPKVQAEQEWDHKPAVRKGFSSKERYVAYRMAELKGNFRMEKAPASA